MAKTTQSLLIIAALVIAVIAAPTRADAQIIPVEQQKTYIDSLRKELYGPHFGLYKYNYFTVGTAIGARPTRTNSDVKFQISLAYRITNGTLPWGTFLNIIYTQKTFWNVFENSLPMHDLNFNPGIAWTKPFFSKDRFVGKMTLLIEHESNGRDSIQSRSWNRVSFCGSAVISDQLMVHAKLWIPIIDGQNNKDILDYCGILQHGVVYTTPNQNFQFGLTLVKRKGWNLNYNTIIDACWRINKKANLNLFAQYYNGYGENLLDYNRFHSRLRVGIVFKPVFYSDF